MTPVLDTVVRACKIVKEVQDNYLGGPCPQLLDIGFLKIYQRLICSSRRGGVGYMQSFGICQGTIKDLPKGLAEKNCIFDTTR